MSESKPVSQGQPHALSEEKEVDPIEVSSLNNGSIRIMKPANISVEVRRNVLHKILLQRNIRDDDDDEIVDSEDEDEDASLSSQDVPEAWREYLKASLPQGNWLALWDANYAEELTSPSDSKHETCRSNSSHSGNLTMVDVLYYDWQDFTACVAVMDPQLSETFPNDENESSVISCPPVEEDELSVPLMELLIIQDEDKDLKELELAAYALDQFQFFHRYLWRPWDSEVASEPASGPAWFLTHLNLRLDLYSQHQVQGNRSPIWVRTQALIREYTTLNNELNDLHAQLDASSELALEDLEPSFTHLELKMMEIRRQGDLVENLARRANLKRAQLQELRRKRDVSASVCHLVRNDDTTGALLALLDKAKSLEFIRDDTVLKFYSSPDKAIDNCLMGDTVLFAPGSYSLLELGELRLGGTIAGLGDDPKATYVISSVQYDFQDDAPNLKVVNLTLLCDT